VTVVRLCRGGASRLCHFATEVYRTSLANYNLLPTSNYPLPIDCTFYLILIPCNELKSIRIDNPPMNTTPEHDRRMAEMTFASVYPHYVTKVERKGRSREELHEVIRWL